MQENKWDKTLYTSKFKLIQGPPIAIAYAISIVHRMAQEMATRATPM